jgi:hypothetical protein
MARYKLNKKQSRTKLALILFKLFILFILTLEEYENTRRNKKRV